MMFLLVSKEKSVLFIGNFRWQVGHTKQKNHVFDNLQEAAAHIFDNIYIETTFCKIISNFIPFRKSCLSAIVQAMSALLCPFLINGVDFSNKTRYGYKFLMKELALRFNTKVHVSWSQYQSYLFDPSIQNWINIIGESTIIHFFKPSTASANLKLPCKTGIPCPELLKIITTA